MFVCECDKEGKMTVVLHVWATPPISAEVDGTCCTTQLDADPTAHPSGRWRNFSRVKLDQVDINIHAFKLHTSK